MALSDEEQRLLEQMEAALAADDPKLAHALRGTGARRLHHRRAVLALCGLVAGVAMLVAGMETSPFVSVLGFVVMLAAAITGITSWQQVDPHAGASHPRDDAAFIDKLEERLRRHHDDGL